MVLCCKLQALSALTNLTSMSYNGNTKFSCHFVEVVDLVVKAENMVVEVVTVVAVVVPVEETMRAVVDMEGKDSTLYYRDVSIVGATQIYGMSCHIL